MHAAAGGRRSGLPRGVTALAILLALPLRADVYVYPNFDFPRILRDEVVLTSSDHRHVIAVGLDGRMRWRFRTRHDAAVMNADDHQLVLQNGREIEHVDRDGRRHRITSLADQEGLVIDDANHASWSGRPYAVTFRDFTTLAPLWTRTNANDVIAVTPTVVVVTVSDTKTNRGPTGLETIEISNGAIVGVDRASGRELWRRPTVDPRFPYPRGMVVGPMVAILDSGGHVFDTQLTVLRPDTGEVLATRKGAFVDFDADGAGHLALIEHDTTDRLRVVEVPSLHDVRDFEIPAQENLRLRVEDGIAMTVGIYSAAAFEFSSGRKLWEIKEQVNATLSHRHVYAAVASRDSKQRVRLIEVDLDAGRERELYSEEPHQPRDSLVQQLRARLGRWKRRRSLAALERKHEVPIAMPLCFAYERENDRLELRLEKNGSAALHSNLFGAEARSEGMWSRSGEIWTLHLDGLYPSIKAGPLSVTLFNRTARTLLPEFLRNLDALLLADTHRDTFSAASLAMISVVEPCAPADTLCKETARVAIDGAIGLPEIGGMATRADLQGLLNAISAFLASDHASDLKFTLARYRGFTYASFGSAPALWPDIPDDAAHNMIDLYWSEIETGDAGREPEILATVPCKPRSPRSPPASALPTPR